MSNKCIESLREEIKEIAMQKPFQIMPLLTVCIGFFMVSLDATVVNVALQSLHISLHTDLSGLQWTVDSYVLSFAALLLSAGLLGDLFGPKKVFCIGLTI
ncbi:MAG TPA: MFS transporter, partial [Aquella sp.]|nr:MFS transporter [Aquella sp.]